MTAANKFAQELAGAIEWEVGMQNEIEEFRNVPRLDLDNLLVSRRVEAALKRRNVEPDTLRVGELAQLTTTAHRGATSIDKIIEEFLDNWDQ